MESLVAMEFEPPQQPKKDTREAERFGGSDTDNYNKPDQVGYADKGGHRERSEYWAPQHEEHWKKEERKWGE